MKKYLSVIVISALIIATISACTDKREPPDSSESSSSAVESSSSIASVESSSSSSESTSSSSVDTSSSQSSSSSDNSSSTQEESKPEESKPTSSSTPASSSKPTDNKPTSSSSTPQSSSTPASSSKPAQSTSSREEYERPVGNDPEAGKPSISSKPAPGYNVYGDKSKGKEVQMPGGTFWKEGSCYYRSYEDWVNGEVSIPRSIVYGETIGDGPVIDWG